MQGRGRRESDRECLHTLQPPRPRSHRHVHGRNPSQGVTLNAAFAGIRRVPQPVNEPNKTYAPGIAREGGAEGPAEVDGGREDRHPADHRRHARSAPGKLEKSVMPHDHGHVLAEYHLAGPEHIQQAIDAAAAARREWSAWPWEDRAAVLLRAAELLATSWRPTINAATMLGQSKTVFQAEIDAASEMIDFWRFNAYFAQELYSEQPISGPGVWNSMEYRNLEGFIYAVSPFNFTAIGGNLTTAPALLGNTVIWKPASSAMLSGYYTYKVLEAAGLPPGVINFLPGQLRRDHQRAARLAGVRRHPLHRQHRRLQQHVEEGRREHGHATSPIRAWSAKPAARTSSSRTRRPIRRKSPSRSRAAASSTRGRSARPRAASTSRSRSVERGPRSRRRDDEGDQGRRRRATSATSWAR